MTLHQLFTSNGFEWRLTHWSDCANNTDYWLLHDCMVHDQFSLSRFSWDVNKIVRCVDRDPVSHPFVVFLCLLLWLLLEFWSSLSPSWPPSSTSSSISATWTQTLRSINRSVRTKMFALVNIYFKNLILWTPCKREEV